MLLDYREVERGEVETAHRGEDVSGKRISILGMARSGVGAARLLHARGASVFVSDSAPAVHLLERLSELKKLGIPFETGEHTDRIYDADMVVLSPGIPSDHPSVVAAAARGIKIISEVEMASWYCESDIVAITGTNGKTTTTMLTGRILEDARIHNAVGGNTGTSFSTILAAGDVPPAIVLEVSSFQLDHIDTFHPKVSAILNITPDHLNRYAGSMERYAASKLRVFENQGPGDSLIFNADDPQVKERVTKRAPAGVRLLPFGTEKVSSEGAYVADDHLVIALEGTEHRIIHVDEISIPGEHNRYNAMAASLAGMSMGARPESIRATLKNFKGVEHRQELVRELGGVRYINDSKATNIDSMRYALLSYKSPIVLILGGRDKGNDYKKILPMVKERVKTIVAIGESAAKVRRAFAASVPVVVAATMKAAVVGAAAAAKPGDIVLLSPACASFDWFRDFEHRGRTFKEEVWALG